MVDCQLQGAPVIELEGPWQVGVYGPLARQVGVELSTIDARRRVEVIHDEREFIDALERIDALILSYTPAPPRGHWASAARLRLIQVVGAGADQLLPAQGLSPQVRIANVRYIQSEAMSEFVLTLVCSLVKQVPTAISEQRQHRWTKYVPLPLRGRTLGILGLGAVGQEVAWRASSLGFRVIGTKRHPQDVPGVDEVFRPQQVDQVLELSDDVLVLLPFTPETEGLLDRRRLALLRPTGTLTVASRGGIVDETALLEMLQEGRLLGAAVDAFETEPLDPASGLWSESSAIVTPHISSAIPDYARRVAEVFLENELLLRRGMPLVSEVVPERGY